MKVLHVIPSISERSGGPGQAIFPMCRALSDIGVEVLLASTDDGLDEDCELQAGREGLYKGVRLIMFPKQLGKSFKYSRPFSGWLNENVAKFDLVHIHAVFNHSCIAAALACQRQLVPYFVRPLGTLDPWSMKQKSLRKKLFWHSGIKGLLTKATAIHYTAKAEQEAVEGSLKLGNGFVVPLGVELPADECQKQRKLSAYFPELDGYQYLLVLSRLHPKKALDVLIDAFLSLVHLPEFSKWRLVIAGDGQPSYVNHLKQMVSKREGEQSIIFTGWLAQVEKSVALQDASLLALPSRQENFGLCVVEAMAHGVPVIVSPQVNLAAEIEESQSGWVAPLMGDKLAKVLAEAMQDSEERAARGRAGAQLARTRFTWPVVAAELSRLYVASVAKVGSHVRRTA